MFKTIGYRLPILAAVLVLALVAAACGGNSEGGLAVNEYDSVSPAQYTPGSAIPEPTGDVILTLQGEIGVTNAGETLEFDMATLENLGLVEYTVDDPWLETKATYTGVLMRDLRKFAGMSDNATSVRMVAIDDFSVDISLEDMEKWPIMLATRSNGEYMDIENAGPTRIIFPYHTGDFDIETYNKFWIWNLKTMDVY